LEAVTVTKSAKIRSVSRHDLQAPNPSLPGRILGCRHTHLERAVINQFLRARRQITVNALSALFGLLYQYLTTNLAPGTIFCAICSISLNKTRFIANLQKRRSRIVLECAWRSTESKE
jgi:hypothetical protein